MSCNAVTSTQCLDPSSGCQTSSQCSTVMATYCSTNDSMTYQQKWIGDEVTSPCKKFVAANLSPVCHSENYVLVVDAFVRKYFLTDGNAITYPQQGHTVFDPTMNDIIQVCQNFPGGCDQVLTSLCNGFTRADLQANPNEATLCGCFLSDTTYNDYLGSFDIDKICDPLCQLQSAVKPSNEPNNCTNQMCNQTICVIDDVTISLLNGSTAGNINFSQICSACSNSSGGCTCDINNVSLTLVQSSVKDVSFNQKCGGPSAVNCFQNNAQGQPQVVSCTPPTTSSGSTTSPASSVSTGTILLIVIGIIVIIVIIIILVVVFRKKRQQPSIFRNGQQPSYIAPPPGAASLSPNY
jgi:hypothetical protein